jgi:aspartyl-tRNA(Asn)/glutamyl-tRNA(Gln) amidotransferase subunit B
MKYEAVIGLEIHIQLKTKSKMFCRCSAEIWNESPNSHTCPVCLGLPGALPVPNKDAIKEALKVGLALNCKPQAESKFDRKNYFYPDLPKGFQISQYDLPFSQNGWVEIEIVNSKKQIEKRKIRIIRAHLEEDTAKLIHANVKGKLATLIDFNRSGIPLMEVVSAPDIHTAGEAKSYAMKIQQIVRYLNVSDADMEKGSLRVEPNVSLRKVAKGTRETKGTKGLPPYKVELKNINSFRSVERAIEYEIRRQSELFDRGSTPIQETRGWDEVKLRTYPQRTKEEAFDYRYFPEPDLPPFEIPSFLIAQLLKQMPELPDQRKERFQKEFGLSPHDSNLLTSQKELADWYEEAILAYSQTEVKGIKAKPDPKRAKIVANWIRGEFLRKLNETGKEITELAITPAHLAELLYLLEKGQITMAVAKTIFSQIFESGQKPSALVLQKRLGIIGKEEIEDLINPVLRKNQKAVEDFKKGKLESLEFLLGQVMKKTQGKIDPKIARALIEKKLS